MIVSMNKITLICQAENRDASLSSLQDLGVLHLTPVQAPPAEALDALRALAAVGFKEEKLP